MNKLIELYQTDRLFKLIARPIMAERSRLNWKRDRLRSELREAGLNVAFEMAELRVFHYYLFPEDQKGRVVKKAA